MASFKLQVHVYTQAERNDATKTEKNKQSKQAAAEANAFMTEYPGPFLLPRTWSRADLLNDFREAEKEDIAKKIQKTFIKNAFDKLNKLTEPEAAVADAVINSVADFAKKVAVPGLVALAFQEKHEDADPAGKMENAAVKKLARSFGKKLIILSASLAKGAATLGLPGLLAGTLFSVIVYLNEMEEAEKERWNAELSKILEEKLQAIRDNKEASLADRFRSWVGRTIKQNLDHDVYDQVTYGYYTDATNKQISFSNGQLIQIRQHLRGDLDMMSGMNDILEAAAYAGVSSKSAPDHTQIGRMNDYLNEHVAANFKNAEEGEKGKSASVGQTHSFPGDMTKSPFNNRPTQSGPKK